MQQPKVGFFFVGFPKSGSTTFYDLLRTHPEVFSPEVKELNHFNTDHIREFERRLGDDYFQLARSEADYSAFFQGPPGRIAGDFNPIYIFSEEAPRNIFNYNPDARILISVREPVSFLRSFHFQSLYNLIEDEPDFLKALALEDSRRAGQNIPQYCHNPFYLYYSWLVEYKQHIERYVEVFGSENVKIILFDDILSDERKAYLEVLDFLRLCDREFVPPRPDRNPSHALRFASLRQLVFTPAIKKWLYTKTPRSLLPVGARISQTIFKKPQEKPSVSKEDIERLKFRFRSQVGEVEAYLAEKGLCERRLLNLWGYR